MDAETSDALSGKSSKGVRNYERWRYETYETKEPDTIAWIDDFIRPGEVLYDVGANIGQYTLYAARRIPNLSVVSFEPESLTFAKLNRNIVANSLSDRVTAYCAGISDRRGVDTLFVNRFTPGASLHTCGRPVTQGEVAFDPQHRQGILTLSLDDLTSSDDFPFPTHVKIDVDGLEERIVQGAAKTLADERLHSVLIEIFFHGDTAPIIQKAFKEAGMTLHNADVITHKPGTVQNFIFTRT
jgi:FkbM family methyltransferase